MQKVAPQLRGDVFPTIRAHWVLRGGSPAGTGAWPRALQLSASLGAEGHLVMFPRAKKYVSCSVLLSHSWNLSQENVDIYVKACAAAAQCRSVLLNVYNSDAHQ